MTNKPELTDERVSNATLIRLIKWAEQHNSHYVEAALRELQERRKADSEPAGYHVVKECGKVGCSVATLEEAKKTRDFWNKKWVIKPYFYAAPPVPAVPEALLFAMEEVLRISDRDHEAWHKAKIDIASCRAAMIQAINHTEQRLDMVDRGWIPVSERIPDNTEFVLCIEKRAGYGTYGQPFVCWHDGDGWVGKTNYRPLVTHWMPLPAAPQHEVK